MNKIFKLSLFVVCASFTYLSSKEDYNISSKNWYDSAIAPILRGSNTKLADQQLIANFIYLVIEKNTNPSQENDQKLNGVLNNCPVNNGKICDPVFELSREKDKEGLKAYYKHVYDNIPEKSRTYEGQPLPDPAKL